MAEKLDMMSKDNVQANIVKIKKLFPNAVTEVIKDGKVTLAVDFDVLKQEMSDIVIDDKQERYQFTWPDKKKAILLANTPISATLRPCKEESVDFDNTQNLYIEGDNLDVLKLLQETYLGKIKMIYIDPPYNTGNDFVYNDDFAESSEEYLSNSGQYDEQGNRLFKNIESNGRFHTDWLNMMYSRLKVSRDLLTEDGAICISIDENEISNMRSLCDEIFGEDNFINTIAVKMSTASGVKLSHRDKTILKTKEYIVIYCKNKDKLVINPQYTVKDKWDDYYEWFVDKVGSDPSKWKVSRLDDILKERGIVSKDLDDPQFKKFYFENADKIWQRGRNTSIPADILEKSNNNWETVFEYGSDNEKQYCYKGRRMAFLKNVLQDCVDGNGAISKDIGTLVCDFWSNISTAALFAEGGVPFPNGKKPQLLLNILIRMFTNDNDYILDYFSGSASTAEAIMRINSEANENRKFIMIQIPEVCDEKSEAYKAGYKTICEVGKARICLASKKIKEENPNTNIDTGFRVLKLDSSNMKEVYYKPEEYSQNFLVQFEDNIKEDRTALDLLFQVMLDLGKPLSAKIEEKVIAGKHVFVVDDNDLIACFDKEITEEVVKSIAEIKPLYAVFRDNSFTEDSTRANLSQILATYSPNTQIKVL